MRLGICGWSQSGKTAVFDALTGLHKGVGDHSSAALKAKVGVAHVHDPRVDFLAGVVKPARVVYASVEYIDLPGLVPDARAHEANPRTLADVRQTDALIAVLRAFAAPAVPHPFDAVDPVRDFRRLQDELLFADLDVADRRIKRLEVDVTKPTEHLKEDQMELAVLGRVKTALEEGKAASTVRMTEPEEKSLRGFRLLTAKPILVVINRGEEDAGKPCPFAEGDFGCPVVPAFGKLEFELSELPESDRDAFMKDLGLTELAAREIIRKGYEVLDQISFITAAGGKEVHAWTIKRGTHAVDAAGAVHSDMQRGFIRAEVVHFDDFKALGSAREARAHGKLRVEGKDYRIQDGDVIEFRFSV